jgi:hypothetical protein
MDNEFSELVLLAWLESSRQEIHDMRQVVCRTDVHTLLEDVRFVEPSWVPYNRQHQF